MIGSVTSAAFTNVSNGTRSYRVRSITPGRLGKYVAIPSNVESITVSKRTEVDATSSVTPINRSITFSGGVTELVTALKNQSNKVYYPLIRFGTGDLSAVLPGVSPCGRTNARIKGWMGRADQTTKVKGLFVHPAQVAAVIARHPEIARARLVVDNPNGVDRMTLNVEVPPNRSSNTEAIVASIREITKLRGEVVFHAPGALPNDGKVIDDVRKYD